jgi:hypothetical protein
MESFGRNLNDKPSGVKNESRWGWLAAAAAAGFWVARKHPRASAALGLGLVAWRCLGSQEVVTENEKSDAMRGTGESLAAGTQEEDEPKGQGEWLLNLEPVPLVIREESVPPMGQGQGDGLLNQEPGHAVEELEWVAPNVEAEFWLNEGVEIPDAVELPELEEPRGTVPQPPTGI